MAPDSPDSTAVRVALWRALHLQADPPPHVIEDEIGLQLAAPDAGFRDVRHVSATDLNQRYFANRSDGLRTSNGEELLVATS